MCFSASASFGAGVVLTVIGIASIKKTHHKSQLFFASIPLIFGVQQVAEGLLWISLPNPDLISVQKIATLIFMIFAQIVWPLWVPIAILLLEKKQTRKIMQKILIGAGFLASGYLTYCLITFGIEAKIIGRHISYLTDYQDSLKIYYIILYALATIASSFFSHVKGMWMLGITILIAYVISALFYQYHILSVWCFFSSIISISIYFIMSNINEQEKQKKSLILTNRIININK